MAKKKYRLHKRRVAAALFVLAAIVVAIYYLFVALFAFIRWMVGEVEKKTEKKQKIEVAAMLPQMVAQDNHLAHGIDSLLHVPQRLDTSLIAVSVYDVTAQKQVYARHADQSLIPASCMKIATAVAALKTLGMDYEYKEHLLVRGEMHRDTLVGTLMLQADDDPLFENFTELIGKMKQKGFRHFRGNVVVSLAREDTLKAHPNAKQWDIPYHKTPILMKGKKRVERDFIYALHIAGVSLKKDATVNSATSKGKYGGKYHYVATTTHSLRDVITPMLIHSSNIKADAVFYHLDWKKGILPERRMVWNRKHFTQTFWENQSIDGDTAKIINKSDSATVFHDGSGLTPDNRLTANILVNMLRYAYQDEKLRNYLIDEALASPASERSGSLLTRMYRQEYKGRIFCKTGTMVTQGASSLSGYVKGPDNHWYIFSIINSNSPVAESRMFQDRLCKIMMKSLP